MNGIPEATPITLSEEERSQLEGLARSTRPIERFGNIIAQPILGGLHH
jgi:hypothetical protein